MIITQEKDNFHQLQFLDEFMLGHKGFICGGCFKNIFNNEKTKDLDIFFESKKDWYDAVKYYEVQDSYAPYYHNDNVRAYKHIESGIVLELCCKVFGSPQEIISNFDFTIVKFAYYKEVDESTTKYMIMYDDKFFEHLHLKRLVIDDLILYPASTFERVLRYAKYGYFPCKESKLKLIKALKDIPNDEIDLSKSLYDGMD